MIHHETLVFDFAVIFGVAAITIVLTTKFKLPSVLGYLIAGVIVGPYIPIPLFANTERVEQISELGVILVMFSIGLQFRIKKLLQVLPSSGLSAFFQILTLFLVGTYLGKIFGWSVSESFLLGAAIAISSTMIIDNVFEEIRVKDNTKKFVYGILVIQDLVAIVLITVLSSFTLGQELGFKELIFTFIKIILFMISLFSIGIFIVPRFIQFALKFQSKELTTIVACGICFTFAIIAELIGYSVALGAFIAGVLVAESGRSKTIGINISQLRSIFSAMFFISVGMSIDPVLSLSNIEYALIISLAIVFFQGLSISITGILSGYGVQTSLIAGLSLGQIGEFSFIIASIGRSFSIISPKLYSIIVTAAVITSISTPILLKYHISIHRLVEIILPRRLQALILVYLSWYNNDELKLRSKNSLVKKNIRIILLNICLMIVLSTIMSISSPFFMTIIDGMDFIPWKASSIYPTLELIFLFPFIAWAIFGAQNLTHIISDSLLKKRKKQIPFYQLIILIIRLSILFLIGSIIMLAISPFFKISLYAFLFLVTLALIMILTIWKKSANVLKQVENGLNRFIKLLRPRDTVEIANTLDIPPLMIPGMEELNMIKIKSNYQVSGNHLSSLNLRAVTGATIFAIIRGKKSISLPGGDEVIFPNDLIAIVGGDESIIEAIKILTTKKSKLKPSN